jgi:uncharacterized membrane protein YciS (DUF1049 family)
MTKPISENTPVVFKMTVIIGALLSVGIWFNNRLSAVEMSSVEQKTDIKYIKESVQRIESAVVKP